MHCTFIHLYKWIIGHPTDVCSMLQLPNLTSKYKGTQTDSLLGAITWNHCFPVVSDDASQLHIQNTLLYSAQFGRLHGTMPIEPSGERMFAFSDILCWWAPLWFHSHSGYKTEGERFSSSAEQFAPHGGPGAGSHRSLKSSCGKLKAKLDVHFVWCYQRKKIITSKWW